MTARLVALCFDANDPARLARFWGEALRWDVDDAQEEVSLVPTDGTAVTLTFIPSAEPRPPGLGRIHLDLTTRSQADQDDTVARLLELGARHLDVGQTAEDAQVVLADPEGNELCVIEPGNRFLAGCGRLGAINCDGTQALGYFWRDVLGWPLIWDQDEETAIRAPEPTGPIVAWGGPPVRPKPAKNHLHLHVAPTGDSTQESEVDRLLSLGATRTDIGQSAQERVVLADPDGNELCVLPS